MCPFLGFPFLGPCMYNLLVWYGDTLLLLDPFYQLDQYNISSKYMKSKMNPCKTTIV